jgi:predicted MPP superfamily phosphohydrolase
MRIAHISDLHMRHHLPGTASVAARLSRLMPDYFARALAQIRVLLPDLLVISGDLIDYPLDALDDPAAQKQGRQDLELIATLLNEIPVPIAIIAGNHDHPELFDKVFGKFPDDQIVNGYRILTFNDHEDAKHVPVRTGQQLKRFRAALKDSKSLPQIHVQHYIVWPERNEEYPHTYGAGASMREAIIETGNVRLLLSGHYHPGVPLFYDKGVWFSTIRSFSEAPHPFVIYEIENNRVTATPYLLAL